ncbi:polyprenol monophosphomannose synthase [Haloferax sp. Atlit-6N]|uniref:polyprenol monophosphomannose synthase n=1 Tax=Haloferax sp. Atlit-6N TaxID=2077205 RepID=UPI000E274D8B|nr:polyprenol monophosphomannose synthase [Haloferax sp. Atlit-6N]REA00164.1 polyprenol monophosphomannose synthase [Haloferax sp. Atlit-6N]
MAVEEIQQRYQAGQTGAPKRETDSVDIYRGNHLESISVIVPTYNEADNILAVIERTKQALRDVEHEIIVVDDDSPDNTWRIVELAYEDDPLVKVYRRQRDKGLGNAVMCGFSQSTYTCCAVIDADLQHPPEKLPELLFHMDDDVEIVIGSRHTDFGRIKRWPLTRRLVSAGATFISKSLLPTTREFHDPLSGFFIVRRDCIEAEQLQPNGYKILLELLVRGGISRAVEVPYVFDERTRGESNLTISEYLNFLTHIFDLRGDIR